jgi:hypothetical protein
MAQGQGEGSSPSTDHVIEHPTAERATWRFQPQTHFAVWRAWPHVSQGTPDGLTPRVRQGGHLLASGLGARHGDALLLPVPVISAQPAHFSHPHPVHGKQQDNSPISDVFGLLPFGGRQEMLYVCPGGAGGQRRIGKETG